MAKAKDPKEMTPEELVAAGLADDSELARLKGHRQEVDAALVDRLEPEMPAGSKQKTFDYATGRCTIRLNREITIDPEAAQTHGSALLEVGITLRKAKTAHTLKAGSVRRLVTQLERKGKADLVRLDLAPKQADALRDALGEKDFARYVETETVYTDEASNAAVEAWEAEDTKAAVRKKLDACLVVTPKKPNVSLQPPKDAA